MRDRGDLPVDKRRSSAVSTQTGAFQCMPLCRLPIVSDDRKAGAHDILDIAFDRVPAPRLREPCAPEAQLVPDRSRNRDLRLMLAQPAHDADGRFRPQRFRDDVGVEQVFHRSKPDIASGYRFTCVVEQRIGIECELRQVGDLREVAIGLLEAAAPRRKLLVLPLPYKNCDRFAAPGQCHRLAIFRFTNQRWQVPACLGDRMCVGHEIFQNVQSNVHSIQCSASCRERPRTTGAVGDAYSLRSRWMLVAITGFQRDESRRARCIWPEGAEGTGALDSWLYRLCHLSAVYTSMATAQWLPLRRIPR